jgi:hypothetical protein
LDNRVAKINCIGRDAESVLQCQIRPQGVHNVYLDGSTKQIILFTFCHISLYRSVNVTVSSSFFSCLDGIFIETALSKCQSMVVTCKGVSVEHTVC